jgi:hypothetical protein
MPPDPDVAQRAAEQVAPRTIAEWFGYAGAFLGAAAASIAVWLRPRAPRSAVATEAGATDRLREAIDALRADGECTRDTIRDELRQTRQAITDSNRAVHGRIDTMQATLSRVEGKVDRR